MNSQRTLNADKLGKLLALAKPDAAGLVAPDPARAHLVVRRPHPLLALRYPARGPPQRHAHRPCLVRLGGWAQARRDHRHHLERRVEEHPMSMPRRIQRLRTPGWRMPPGAVYVGRPSRWSNPFPIRGDWAVWAAPCVGCRADEAGRREAAVRHYRDWLRIFPGADDADLHYRAGLMAERPGWKNRDSGELHIICGDILTVPRAPTIEVIRAELRGRDLVCWCPLDQPCHADVLLKLANAPPSLPFGGTV